jgi:hypothetical protein
LQKVIANNFRLKKPVNSRPGYPGPQRFVYSDKFFTDELIVNLRARILAIAIFLFFFIENGTLGLLPEKYYFIYRNVKISDFILYGTVFYSLVYYKEYKNLIKSRSMFLIKLLLAFFLLEYFVSFLKYGFNPIETFFRLKGLWSSFLLFPFLLLLQRNGFDFLIKLVFPVAILSNILYILSALTGIPFLAGVAIVKQRLSGDIEVYRVFGGTFFGDLFYLGYIYYWITKRFRLWQLGLAILFVIPHILAFGRSAWVGLIFTVLVMVLLNSLRKRQFRILVRQAILLILLSGTLILGFIQFIPESDFYIEAVKTRLLQGQNDVNYSEGTYGSRVLVQNTSLVQLWSENDIILGIGMHPMWVIRPESREEEVYYSAFCDVGWPSILAAYGIVGFGLAIIFQIYLILKCFKIIRNIPDGTIFGFLTTAFLAKLLFDTFICFSYVFVSTHLWGFFYINYFLAVFVYNYETVKNNSKNSDSVSNLN